MRFLPRTLQALGAAVLVLAVESAAQAVTPKQQSQGIKPAEIDQVVQRAMKEYNVPGLAVGLIKDGEVIHARGYGVREHGKSAPVDEKTLFGIASTGKSFTAAAMALLVDEGKIAWDDRVIDYLPQFQMYDPWVTREFQIRDLLIHNSGLGLGAGDLMLFPSENFTREEIIHNLRYLKPVTSFRSTFAYDNLLYVVAGEVIAVVSGQSYEDFVDKRILQPLGMKHCAANLIRIKGAHNVAKPHQVVEGELTLAIPDVEPGVVNVSAAAGGMLCSVDSALKWLEMHLRGGQLSDGSVLISPAQHRYIFTPHTIIPPLPPAMQEMFGSDFSAYGLGWNVLEFSGYKMAHHGGAITGMLSQVWLIPELQLGLVIYTNQQAAVARHAIGRRILEAYTSDQQSDWVAIFKDFHTAYRAQAQAEVPDPAQLNYTPTRSLTDYTGEYVDPWFGRITISKHDGQLYFASERQPRLSGEMVPYQNDLFIAVWDDRSLQADAYVQFSNDFAGKPKRILMQAVSPLTDFSFDFHDLDFSRFVSAH
ncbi:MAG: serine hydrolase [Pseudomonadota bacterium]